MSMNQQETFNWLVSENARLEAEVAALAPGSRATVESDTHLGVLDDLDHEAVLAQEKRVHALGAAISRRDWHAVEQAHAAIRDAATFASGSTPTVAHDERRMLEIRAQHERETGTHREDTSEFQDVRYLLGYIDRLSTPAVAATVEQCARIADGYMSEWDIKEPIRFVDGNTGPAIGRLIRALTPQPSPAGTRGQKET